MNALKGHTTGLQITGSDGTPGKDGALLLRGLGTFYGNDDGSGSSSTPLIVIDGVVTGLYQYQWGRLPSDIVDYGIERCSFYGYLRFEGCDGRDRGDDPERDKG